MGGIFKYRQEVAQQLIQHPEETEGILASAATTVEDYYHKVAEVNPLKGKYKVARTLRSIALSAVYFNGVTMLMNKVGSDLRDCQPVSESAPPMLSNWASPLDRLNLFSIKTPAAKRFIYDLGGLMLAGTPYGDYDADARLMKASDQLHEQYFTSKIELEGQVLDWPSPEKFFNLTAEDNAHAVLHSLVAAGGAKTYRTGVMPAATLAAHALHEQATISNLASVSRSFAAAKIRPHIPEEKGRAVRSVAAYEEAIQENQPMDRQSIASYFSIHEGALRSPHQSLKNGPWREPAMCPGFPSFEARTHEETLGNRQFFEQMERIFNVSAEPFRQQTHFSAVEAALNFGVLAGYHTIYTDFPTVAD